MSEASGADGLSGAPDSVIAASRRPFSERPSTMVALIMMSGSVLGMAAWLQPALEGHGTHQQLGLRPCTFLSITGYPCPMCGATTTFALMADLRVGDALVNQPFAVILFGITVGVFSVSVADLVQPRGRWTRILSWIAPYEGHLAVAFLILMGLAWAYKIALMSPIT